jgi:hypothetical protein
MVAAPLLAAALASGLFGAVTRGPTQPVCMVGKPCSAPAPHVILLFTRGDRTVRARTDDRGRYRVALLPGAYRVSLTTQPRIGRGLDPRTVVVGERYRRADFTIDTGIR